MSEDRRAEVSMRNVTAVRWQGVLRPSTSRVHTCAHLSTLRHFDTFVQGTVKNDPLIPCERRLLKTEILEFQEVNSEACFVNRDYDRPFRHILVTLGRFG